MSRSLVALVLVLAATIVSTTGCTTCASPYDYCGPVYAGGCEPCVNNDRVGSAFCDPGLGPEPMISPNSGKRSKPGAGGAEVNLEDRNLPDLDEGSPPRGDNMPNARPSAPSPADELEPPSARLGPQMRR
ncbi:MAG: hypothetical protein K1X74_18160 [Pirellulales bacterium]|nr:hypothetical protein [Pirellulales bacterium]